MTEALPLLHLSEIRIALDAAGEPGVPVVDGVSLSLSKGETIGIAGESGCGKSTLLLAMMGIVKPGLRQIAGSCVFNGIDMATADPDVLDRLRGNRIAMVPQNAVLALTPTIRVGDHIDEVLGLHGGERATQRRQRMLDLLARVQLPDPAAIARRFPHELSGGQLQRVAIAMALACDPDLLLLDEPTSGLDVTTRLALLLLLEELRRERGLAMVCVSHDVGVLTRLSDRIMVMYAGRVVEDRGTAALLAMPAHPYTRALLGAVPRLSGRTMPQAIPGRPPTAGEPRASCGFAPRCTRSAASACRAMPPPALRNLPGGGAVACADPVRAPLEKSAQPEALPAVQAGEAVLTVADLSVTYGRRSLLAGLLGAAPPPATVNGVGFELRRGETLALIGESGSGKSTILKVLAGLWPASAGSLRLDGGIDLGKSATRRPREALRRMQLVFQNPDSSLNPRQTVREILAQPLRLYFNASATEVESRATRLLADVRLDAAYLDRYPSQMSGGERQRVAIARAFAAEPEVILCDEVTSALDVSVQASVLRLIRDLCRSRAAACLFVAHDLAVVAALADRIAVLKSGRLVEIGDVATICQAPTHAYTRSLVAAAIEPSSPASAA
jgi:peptide/nickel transport system ATP-binding protein